MLLQYFLVVSKIVLNIDIFQGIVSKLETVLISVLHDEELMHCKVIFCYF